MYLIVSGSDDHTDVVFRWNPGGDFVVVLSLVMSSPEDCVRGVDHQMGSEEVWTASYHSGPGRPVCRGLREPFCVRRNSSRICFEIACNRSCVVADDYARFEFLDIRSRTWAVYKGRQM